MNMIQVLLVDDYEVVRAGYRRLLENAQDIKVIAEASNGEEAYILFMKQKPDVVIMDLSMPGIGGLEAIRRIKCQDKEARILVFSVHESDTFLKHALNEGALGYITKRSAAKVMVEAVREVASGNLFIGQDMQVYLTKKGEPPSLEQLSAREFEVFLLLAEGKTVNEIAEILNLSPKTIGHHYTNIKNKLNADNVAELTRLAIREKLIEP